MSTEKDKIKDIFSSKLAGFEADPPQDTWNRIADSLPVETVPVRSNKIQLYKRIAIVSTVAAAVILSFVFLLNDGRVDNGANELVESLPIEALNPAFAEQEGVINEEVIFDDKKILSENNKGRTSRIVASNNLRLTNSGGNYAPSIDIETSLSRDDNESDTALSDAKSVDDLQNKDALDEVALHAKIRAFADQANSDIFAKDDNKAEKIKTRKGISLSLAGNTGFSKNNDNKTEVTNSLRNVYGYYEDAVQSIENVLPASEKELPAKITHQQPVSFGIMVSKDLNSKLSIETGVVYTYLSSKIKNKPNANLKRSDSQYFHYLGVPVSLNYNFAKWDKADFYASVGGMIQKDFYGLYKEDQMMLNNKEEQNRIMEKTKIHQSSPQFSVLGKVGVSYPIINKIHAYATVGGAYYFDAGHKHKIIYSDKKLQLDLNIGLKFKF